MTIFYFGRKGIEQTGFSGFRSRFIPTFAPLTPERLRRPYNPAQALSSVRNWCSEQKRLERGFVYGGTGIARLRSLCNASYVRPTNRAFARFVLDVFHHKKKNLPPKPQTGFLGVSPKQSDGHG